MNLKQNWDQLPEKEFIKGLFGKIIHTEHMTMVRWRFEKNASLPEHSHPHEQITFVLNGELLLNIDNKEIMMYIGDVQQIRSNLPHSGKAITNCDVIDIFSPKRYVCKWIIRHTLSNRLLCQFVLVKTNRTFLPNIGLHLQLLKYVPLSLILVNHSLAQAVKIKLY